MLTLRPDLLITGATGNVGSETIRFLNAAGVMPLAAVRSPDQDRDRLEGKAAAVRLDFTDPSTYTGALNGVKRLLLVRPPQLAEVDRTFRPLLEEAVRAGVQQVVFLSLLGAATNTVVPHHKIEKLILELGVPHVFLRASFFMQNLSSTHRVDIRDHDQLMVPAANGSTSFIDAADIGAVAAQALLDGVSGLAHDLTGDAALTYDEVAGVLSKELGRPIRYPHPNVLQFALERRRQGDAWPFIGVMIGIYAVAALGKAGQVTPVTHTLLGRPARTLREFVRDHRAVWQKADGRAEGPQL